MMQNSKRRKWVLIRGLARGQKHWGEFAEALQAEYPQDEFLFLDLAGNGSRFQEKSAASISMALLDLRRHYHLPVDGKYHLVSISMGSMVALEWFKQFPNEIEHVFCINTSSRFSPFFKRLKFESMFTLAKAIFLSVEEREKLILRLTSNHPEMRKKYEELFIQESLQHPVQIKNFFLQLWSASQYHPPKKNEVEGRRLHFLVSRYDRLCDFSCSQALAQNYQSNLSTHEQAGHDLPLDDESWLRDQIRATLDSISKVHSNTNPRGL